MKSKKLIALYFDTYGKLLRSLRLNAGFTQAQLARKIKTKQSAIARLEKSKKDPSLSTMFKIAEACGATMTPPQLVPKPQHECSQLKYQKYCTCAIDSDTSMTFLPLTPPQ